MHIKTTFKIFGALYISCILAACGGGSSENGSALQNAIDGEENTGTTTNSSSVASAIGSDTLQSIEFKDAVPSVINLKGTGGSESSLVRFRALGQTGLPIKNIIVDFALSSDVGNIKLSQNSGTSDKDGYVSTSVISGTVSTSMKVVATVRNDVTITAQSNELVVATGLPDQKSMSMSLEKFNPPGWNYDGITASVNVLLADAYNNPAEDGTAVYFTTEGGSIGASCTTTAGGCSVLWKSQSPKPPRASTDNSIDRILCLNLADDALAVCRAERAGRSTILATVVGNESFKDQNADGIYDPGLDLFATSNDAKCTPSVPYSSYESNDFACDDLAEAYLDTNENGIHDTGEYHLNFVTDTTKDVGSDNYTPHNGLYNGAFCQPDDESDGLCSRTPVSIRKEHMVIMSCDEPLLDGNTFPVIGTNPLAGTNTYAIADCNGNPLPVGTTITVGANPATTVGNEYDWSAIEAAPGTVIKLAIPIGTTTKNVPITAR